MKTWKTFLEEKGMCSCKCKCCLDGVCKKDKKHPCCDKCTCCKK